MMQWWHSPYALPPLLAAATLSMIALYIWQRRNGAPGATAFALLLVAGAIWATGYALSLGSTDLTTKILLGRPQVLRDTRGAAAWLAFALSYTGRGGWLTRLNLALLAVVPLVTLLVIFTNGAHGLFWRSREPSMSGSFPTIEPVYGPWFWTNTVYFYLLMLVGTLLLVRAFASADRLYRGQRTALMMGALLPWLVIVSELLHTFPKTLRETLRSGAQEKAGLRTSSTAGGDADEHRRVTCVLDPCGTRKGRSGAGVARSKEGG